MIFALVSSGRSDFAISAPAKLESPASPAPDTASTVALPPVADAFSNAVPRTVITFFASDVRSEEHTSELQSLMRISYAVFCLKKKKKKYSTTSHSTSKHSHIK